MHQITMNASERLENISVYVESSLAERLREAARERERSLSGEIRFALKRHLERPVRPGFLETLID